MASFSHSAFQDNGLSTGDYSVFVNTGAELALEHSSLGPVATSAFFNNAGNTVSAVSNYWDHSAGPFLPWEGHGSGSTLSWNPHNGSYVDHLPFLSIPPLDTQINEEIGLSAKATTTWSTAMGLALSLKGAPDISPTSGGLAAALRLQDISALTNPTPPHGTFAEILEVPA